MPSDRAKSRNLSKWLASSILLFLNIPSSISQPTYEWRDVQTNEKLICQQCPPGTSVAQHCTKDSPTLCQACPSLYYTQYWNYLESCLYCNVFCDRLEVEVQQCNGTHNRACQCKPGYYSDSDFCLRHSKCPVGTGVVQQGNLHEDTQCAPCVPGTFSSNSSHPCQPHRNCPKEGLEVNVPGNQYHDTLCTSCNTNRTNTIEETTAELAGNRDCQEAMIDFVPYQVRSQNKLLHMMRVFGMDCSLHPKKCAPVLQVELHTYLIQLKNTLGAEQVVQKLLSMLRNKRLTHVLHEFQKRFHLSRL
ncbi:tumor necrosis factor receptor superfamily member 6B [Tiliqua scincoides]|uniref:tumor necrosis factor receptor superfamily member 6B n=1 Tax=Tiliqua scincoides TaxID=71010 RepID=UPI003461B201